MIEYPNKYEFGFASCCMLINLQGLKRLNTFVTVQNRQIMANKGKLTHSGLNILPPSLSSPIKIIYDSLDTVNKSLFIKVYRYLWGVALPFRRASGPLGCVSFYWAVDIIRVKRNFTNSELNVLSYIYYITDQGKTWIHSDIVYDANLLPLLVHASVTGVLNDIKLKGLIIRSSRNPDKPYLKTSVCTAPAFIKLTAKGVQTIKGIEEDIYKMLLNTSLNDLTGANKKA
jgi:hypothetical protein